MIENENNPSADGPQVLTFLERYQIHPVIFAILSLVVLFTTYQIIGGLLAYILFGNKFSEENVTGIRWLTVFSQITFLLIPTLLLTKLATLQVKDFLRFNKTSVLLVLLSFLGIFSLGQMLQVYMVLQDQIPIPQSIKPFVEQLKETIEHAYRTLAGSKNIGEFLFVTFVVALVPAFSEEILFRGMIQSSFEKVLFGWKAVIITGIIFGAFHLNPFTFIPLSAIGIYLGFLAVQSNSIYVPISAHFFNNFVAVIAIHFNYAESELITGKPDEMTSEMLIFTFLFFSIVFFVTMYYFIAASKISKSKNQNIGV